MSGGYWDYIQYRFTDIIEDIQKKIDNNGKPLTEQELKEHYHGPDWFEKYPEDKFHHKYSDEVLAEFKNAVDAISKAQVYMQRIDWLLSGDDGEESFLSRLKNELSKIESEEKYSIDELRHLAVNYAITCEKGFTGSFDEWFSNISPRWREYVYKK